MERFTEFNKIKAKVLSEAELLEALIIINNSANYGQVVLLAGGAGSGKGFAIDKFLEGNKFKIRDVDEWKRLYIKLKGLNIDTEGKTIADFLKSPENVRRVHELVDQADIKDKTLKLLLKDINQNTLPNIIFDITAKKISSVYEIAEEVTQAGYNPANVNIIWVLASYDVASAANKKRDRVVPEDILLDTHFGASETMTNLIFKGHNRKLIDGAIYIILNNRDETTPFDKTGNQRPQKTTGPGAETTELYNKKMTNIAKFTYIQVKKSTGAVTLDDRMKAKVKEWIEVNTPMRMYSPKERTIEDLVNLPGYIETIRIGKGLEAVMHDSDPFDAITYVLNGIPIATEYKSSYERRIADIKTDLEGFIELIQNYKK
jgi:dephospho-CoA kinase